MDQPQPTGEAAPAPVADTAGGCPAEDPPGGADAKGRETTTADPEGGDEVVSLFVEVGFPSSWKGAREHIGDTLFPMLRADSGRFEDVGGADPASERPPAKNSWGVTETETLGQVRLRHGTLYRHEVVTDKADTSVMVATSYEIDGEGDDLRAAVRDHGLLMLRAHLAAVRECADPRLQMSLHAWLLGDTGGEMFCELLRDPGRDVPLLALTDVPSYPLLFFRWAEFELVDRAIVASLDDDAADRLTDSVGKEWSCFSGSARIYRPGWSEKDRHDRHPIWRRRKILPEGHDADFAQRAFRDEVFREVFVSPGERDRERLEEAERHAAALQAMWDDQEGLLKRAGEELDEARLEVDVLKEDKERLEQDKRDLKSRLDDLRERRTVQKAVEWVADTLGDELVIGEKAREGAGELGPDAGPPGKVFRHLVRLGEFAREMRKGGAVDGTSDDDAVARWFQERGCRVGRDRGRTQDESARDFPVNGKTHRFDWHTRPDRHAEAEGVRIHFKWDPDSGKVLVGWIGPHLRAVAHGAE